MKTKEIILNREDFNKSVVAATIEMNKKNPKIFNWKVDPNSYKFFSYTNRAGVFIRLVCQEDSK